MKLNKHAWAIWAIALAVVIVLMVVTLNPQKSRTSQIHAQEVESLLGFCLNGGDHGWAVVAG